MEYGINIQGGMQRGAIFKFLLDIKVFVPQIRNSAICIIKQIIRFHKKRNFESNKTIL